jgi:hypothetical protein
MKGWIGTTAQAFARLEKVEPFDDFCHVCGAPDGEVSPNRGQS